MKINPTDTMTKETNTQRIIERFREEFIQDHNRGEERFLRGLFIEDFEQWLASELEGLVTQAQTDALMAGISWAIKKYPDIMIGEQYGKEVTLGKLAEEARAELSAGGKKGTV